MRIGDGRVNREERKRWGSEGKLNGSPKRCVQPFQGRKRTHPRFVRGKEIMPEPNSKNKQVY